MGLPSLGVGALAPTFPLPLVIPTGARLLCPVCFLPGWPIFSFAPHLGASAAEHVFLCPVCFTGMEGSWQHLNLNQAPSASNQLDRREAWVHSSPLLRRPGLQFILRIEGPRRKPPQNNSSPHPFLRPNPRTGDFNRHERLFPLFSSRVSEARFFGPACFTGMEGPWQHVMSYPIRWDPPQQSPHPILNSAVVERGIAVSGSIDFRLAP